MRATEKSRVKNCGISSIEEAEIAIKFGASALGLVSAMPSEPGVIYEDLIAKIATKVPPGVSTFLLTSHLSYQLVVTLREVSVHQLSVNSTDQSEVVGLRY